MTTALTILEQKLNAPETTRKLAVALNLNPDDEEGQRQAFKYASSVLAEVAKTAGDSKKDLTVCVPDSIVQAMIDAAQYQLAIDGRQLAHLVKYGNRATFMPGYRAYIYKIKQNYPDADITVECIFDGDTLKIWGDDTGQHYSLTKGSDPFDQSIGKFKGVLFAVSYTDGGRLVSKVMAVPKDRIERARKAAKQDYIWASDYFEKAKAAAIKNACKTLFTSIQGLQDMAREDNEVNYDIDKQPAAATRPSIVDNINATLAPEPKAEVVDDSVIEAEVVEDNTEVVRQAVEQAGLEAANLGMAELLEWSKGLTDDEKEYATPHKAAWVKIAKEADANKNQEEDLPI